MSDQKLITFFAVISGEHKSFTQSSEGVTFEEMREGLTTMRDELNRLLDNADKCPYHKTKGLVSKIGGS